MDTSFLYGVTTILLICSFFKNREKTLLALKKGLKSFMRILPQFLSVITLVGLMLAVLNPKTISGLIGNASGWWGVVLSALIGSITLIPGFLAFSTASTLIENGAGYMQIAAFVSSLMMVGIITYPVEVKYFGGKVTFLRNFFSLCFTFIVALIIGMVMN